MEVAVLGGRFVEDLCFFSPEASLYMPTNDSVVVAVAFGGGWGVGRVIEGLKFSLCQFNRHRAEHDQRRAYEQGPLSWCLRRNVSREGEVTFMQKAVIRVHVPACLWGVCPHACESVGCVWMLVFQQ